MIFFLFFYLLTVSIKLPDLDFLKKPLSNSVFSFKFQKPTMTRSYNRDHRIVRALVCTDFGTLLIQSIIEQIAGIGDHSRMHNRQFKFQSFGPTCTCKQPHKQAYLKVLSVSVVSNIEQIHIFFESNASNFWAATTIVRHY